jgi:hypothetical protein
MPGVISSAYPLSQFIIRSIVSDDAGIESIFRFEASLSHRMAELILIAVTEVEAGRERGLSCPATGPRSCRATSVQQTTMEATSLTRQVGVEDQ